MWSLLTVHCVVSRTALVTLPTAGHGSPHPPALQRCTVLYCAVLYTVLCPPHYTLPTLHTCDKCDMLVRRELNNSAPLSSHHLIPSRWFTDPRDPSVVLSSPQLPARLCWCWRGQLSSAATSLPCPRPGQLTPPLHRGDNVQSSIQKISIHLKLDT